MKYIAEIEVPEDACWQDVEYAKANAIWKEVHTVKDRMSKTDLNGKCGSCKYFVSKPDLFSKCYGNCLKGRAGYKQRTCRACTLYERKTDE